MKYAAHVDRRVSARRLADVLRGTSNASKRGRRAALSPLRPEPHMFDMRPDNR